MATALYNHPPLADFILGEANGQRSRDNVIVRQSGAAVRSGTVLSSEDAGSAKFAMADGSTGNPTIGTITVGATAAEGIYRIEFVSPTAFRLEGPNGAQVGSNGALGTAFSAGGIGFTLTAGATAAVAGDEAVLDVAPPRDTYAVYDGSKPAAAVLYSHLPAATGSTPAVAFTGDCEVKRSALIGLDAAGETALAERGIKVRGKPGVLSVHTPAL